MLRLVITIVLINACTGPLPELPTAERQAPVASRIELADHATATTLQAQAGDWFDLRLRVLDQFDTVMQGATINASAPALLGDERQSLAFPVGTSCSTDSDGLCQIGLRALGDAGDFEVELSAGTARLTLTMIVTPALGEGLELVISDPERGLNAVWTPGAEDPLALWPQRLLGQDQSEPVRLTLWLRDRFGNGIPERSLRIEALGLSAQASDAGPRRDAAPVADAGLPIDSGAPSDSGPPSDLGAGTDAQGPSEPRFALAIEPGTTCSTPLADLAAPPSSGALDDDGRAVICLGPGALGRWRFSLAIDLGSSDAGARMSQAVEVAGETVQDLARHLAFTGDAQARAECQAGALSAAIEVVLVDGQDQAVPGEALNASADNGFLAEPAQAYTDAQGTARFFVRCPQRFDGPGEITISHASGQTLRRTIEPLPGAAHRLVVTRLGAQPGLEGFASAGAAVRVQLAISDQAGNPIAGLRLSAQVPEAAWQPDLRLCDDALCHDEPAEAPRLHGASWTSDAAGEVRLSLRALRSSPGPAIDMLFAGAGLGASLALRFLPGAPVELVAEPAQLALIPGAQRSLLTFLVRDAAGNGVAGARVTLTLPEGAPLRFERLIGNTDALGRFDAFITDLQARPVEPIAISASALHGDWSGGPATVMLSAAGAALEALALFDGDAAIPALDGVVPLRTEVQSPVVGLRLRALNARGGGVPDQAVAFRSRSGEGLLDAAHCPLPSGGSSDDGGWLEPNLRGGTVAGICGFSANVGATTLHFNLSIRPGVAVGGELLAGDCQNEVGELPALTGYQLRPEPFPQGEQAHALCVCPRDALGNALVGEALFLAGSNYHLAQDPFAVPESGCAAFAVVGGGNPLQPAELALDSGRGWQNPPRFSFAVNAERPALEGVILDGLTDAQRVAGSNNRASEVAQIGQRFVINPREPYPNEIIEFILTGATTTGSGALVYPGEQLDEQGFCTGQGCAVAVFLLLDHGAGVLDPPIELGRRPITRRIESGEFVHYAVAPRSLIAPGGRMAVLIEQPTQQGQTPVRSGAARFDVARQISWRARSARLLSPSRDNQDRRLDALVQSVALADLDNDGEDEMIACASDANGALAAVLGAEPERLRWGGSPFVDQIEAARGPRFAANLLRADEQRPATPTHVAGFCHVINWGEGRALLQWLSPNSRNQAAAKLVFWPLGQQAPFLGEPRLLSLSGLPPASLAWSRWNAESSRLDLCTSTFGTCPANARFMATLRRDLGGAPVLSAAQASQAFSAEYWPGFELNDATAWPQRCGNRFCFSTLINGPPSSAVPVMVAAKTWGGRGGYLAFVLGSDRLGWIEPLASAPACGDGQIGPGESCDDGNHNPYDGCNTDCSTPVCGDGRLAASEACDDGNPIAGDGCAADCQLEGQQPAERWQYGALAGFVPLAGGESVLGNLTAFAMQRSEALYSDARLMPIDEQTWYQGRRHCRQLGGDLASEAQWQWAAQSQGQTGNYPWGDTAPVCAPLAPREPYFVANTEECGLGQSRPACSMPSGRSAQGLCELAGNADWEWVLDGRDGPNGEVAASNPVHRLRAGGTAVRRGGSFSSGRDYAQANNRDYRNRFNADLGFRCVLGVVAPEP